MIKKPIEIFIGDLGALSAAEERLNAIGSVRPLASAAEAGPAAKSALIVARPREIKSLTDEAFERWGGKIRAVAIMQKGEKPSFGSRSKIVHACVSDDDPETGLETLKRSTDSAVAYLRTLEEKDDLLDELDSLNRIGVALSSERDTERLLELILASAREIVSCDAGSLYLVETGENGKHLHFAAAQNDSIKIPFAAVKIPLNPGSIAGFVAESGEELHIEDAYAIPPDAPYSFNRDFDKKSGYRTVNVLAIPIKNQRSEILGVVQLINRKDSNRVFFADGEDAARLARPFDEKSRDLARSLAGQAGAALENVRLIEELKRAFGGFVKASIVAIESRDPPTKGHSARVAQCAAALAMTVSASNNKKFADAIFDRDKLDELKYAALLHDFGKVGVPEALLLKANKLPEGSEELINLRLALIKTSIERDALKKERDCLESSGAAACADNAALTSELRKKAVEKFENAAAFILAHNKKFFTDPPDEEEIKAALSLEYKTERGETIKLIDETEAKCLSIPRGTLTKEERALIETHVTHSYNFLKQIPWSRNLELIPEIAYSHHERINGSGYPRGLSGENIPLQSRIIAVADLYDVLTASDRPYKKALPLEKTLEIMRKEAAAGFIDGDLVELFVSEKVYERVSLVEV